MIKIDGQSIPDYETYAAVNNVLKEGEWDVVLGTRMLIKGFDFGEVDLTAALLMDNDINFGDYSSGENAYQLYSRFFNLSDHRAIGQTYDPENEVILALKSQEPEFFYRGELEYRQMLGYPPAGHLVVFSIMSKDGHQAKKDAYTLGRNLQKELNKVLKERYMLYKPVMAGRQAGGNIRYKMLVKLKALDVFQSLMGKIIQNGGIENLSSRVAIEIDPPATI